MEKLIIFDLDGTLINSIEDLHISVNYSLKKNNYPLATLEHTRKSIGNGVAMLMKRSLPSDISEKDYKKALNDFEEHYQIHKLDHTKPYDNMLETLKILKEKGFLLAVSTNKIEDAAKKIIDKYFEGIFITVCGDNNIRKKKPAPDSIIEIKRRINIDLKEIYYVGDSEVDYLTAINSNCTPIIVSYGYRTKEELLSKIPSSTKIIDNCLELTKIF